MSEKSDLVKLELVLKYIDDIERICVRHSGVDNALTDYEGQYAILMCLSQIGEVVNKICTERFIGKIPVKEISGFRNRIDHNYEGIDLTVVKMIISKNLIELKQVIIELLS